MSTPALIMWATVFAVGLLSIMGKSTTAGALVAAWLGVELILPDASYSIYADIFVLAVIAAKPNRTPIDWAIVAIFPVIWAAYVADMHPYYTYWALYYLVLLQLCLAGGGARFKFRRAERTNKTAESRGTHGTLRVVYEGGGGG